MTDVLCKIFLEQTGDGVSHDLHSKDFITLFANFKGDEGRSFSELVFGHPTRQRLNRDIKVLLMKLFASGMLTPRPVHKKVEGVSVPSKVSGNLAYDRFGMPLFHKDSYWEGFILNE